MTLPLTPQRLRTLRILAHTAWDRPMGLTDIAAALGISKTSATDRIFPLYEAGWVQRARRPRLRGGYGRDQYRIGDAGLAQLAAGPDALVLPRKIKVMRNLTEDGQPSRWV